ncbi:hypothetical protein LUZ60_009387 [Juncus effusus]|nr:hypothetical protein LUZ60_009387 [Juncus effusus]
MGGEKGEIGVVGCRVLPLCDAVSVGSDVGDCSEIGDQKIKGRTSEKRRGVARMRELIKWAAAASKSSRVGSKARKLLQNRNNDVTRDGSEARSSNSSKINYIWEVGSCSSASSVYSNRTNQMLIMNLSNLSQCLSIPALSTQNLSEKSKKSDFDNLSKTARPSSDECVRNMQWITTDSDFVVLEL